MNLEEYRQSTDSNDYWRMSSGEVQVILDEAVEKIEDLEEQIAIACEDCPVFEKQEMLKAEIETDEQNIARLMGQVQELSLERDQLQARVAELESMIKNAPVSSGVCCCGESMHTHAEAFISGHEPVDEWDYHSKIVLDRAPAQSLAMVKAEALREFAKNNLAFWGESDTAITLEDAVDLICEQAERMEAEAESL